MMQNSSSQLKINIYFAMATRIPRTINTRLLFLYRQNKFSDAKLYKPLKECSDETLSIF